MKSTTLPTFTTSFYNDIIKMALTSVYSYESHSGLKLPSDAAAEIAHIAAIKVWNSLGKFDPTKSKLSTWVGTIARNSTITYAKQNRQHDSLYDVDADGEEYLNPELDMASNADPENEMIASETRQRLDQTLSTVSAVDKKVFQMRMDGVPPREIASEVHLSTSSVSKRISVTRGIVRVALAA